MYWSRRSDVSADRANTNGPMCSLRMYRLIIFTQKPDDGSIAELQEFQRVVPPCTACIFHPSPARFKADQSEAEGPRTSAEVLEIPGCRRVPTPPLGFGATLPFRDATFRRSGPSWVRAAGCTSAAARHHGRP